MSSRKPPSVLLALASIVSILVILLVCIHLAGCLNYYDPSKACNGYTLVSNDNVAKLLDMDGNAVKTWDLNCFPAKMFPGGSVMAQKDRGAVDFELVKVVQMSWDGEIEWEYSDWDEVNGIMAARVHHDFQKDGNPVGYYAPGQEPLAYGGKVLVLGRLTTLDPEISDKPLFDDTVYEVDWDTKEAALLWKSSEHFDELGFDEQARQLIHNKGGDYLHINSVSRIGPNRWYDPESGTGDARFHPDNLIIDAREANIIWIANMAEGTGFGMGEIVWKVGPDYSAGTPEGDKLGQIIGQHHAHMIPEGLPGAGNILVFDNGGMAGYPHKFRWTSRILEFDPVTLDLVWKYEDPNFFSFYISSAQRLPNGNTLIDAGSAGRIFEVTTEGEVVWDYSESMQPFGRIYRAYRIPPEWVPGNPSGYTPWSEQYAEAEVAEDTMLEGESEAGEESKVNAGSEAGGEGMQKEPEPENPPQELVETLP